MENNQFINKGVIFTNNYKKADTHPDFKGKINVEGLEKEIALWVKKDKNGNAMFSAAISNPWNPDGDKEPVKEAIKPATKSDDLPF